MNYYYLIIEESFFLNKSEDDNDILNDFDYFDGFGHAFDWTKKKEKEG